MNAIKPLQRVKQPSVPARAVALKVTLKASKTHAPQGKTEPCKLNIDKPRLAQSSHIAP
jgi:hypothetical protein